MGLFSSRFTSPLSLFLRLPFPSVNCWFPSVVIYLVPGDASGKEPACQCRRHKTWVQSLGWEDPLEEEMVTRSSILAWRIPWIEEPGGVQSMGSQRLGHN